MELKTNEIVAFVLFIFGLFDMYFLPKVFVKTNARIEKKQMDNILMVFKITSYITIGLGVLFLLNIIPISVE